MISSPNINRPWHATHTHKNIVALPSGLSLQGSLSFLQLPTDGRWTEEQLRQYWLVYEPLKMSKAELLLVTSVYVFWLFLLFSVRFFFYSDCYFLFYFNGQSVKCGDNVCTLVLISISDQMFTSFLMNKKHLWKNCVFTGGRSLCSLNIYQSCTYKKKGKQQQWSFKSYLNALVSFVSLKKQKIEKINK